MKREEIHIMKKKDSSICWVIDFKKSDPKRSGTLLFEFYTPQEPSAFPKPKRKKSQYKALEFLQQIQDSCESLKEECRETSESGQSESYEEQITRITEDIGYLFGMIKEFTQLMQKLQRPPEDSSQKEEKNP
ncbi:putative uncharacterized protein [Waddlia chondrophila 2032/99]|uniref:Uncharacterized protein n=1 Tax=Waddlia chondrophila 2032/99 TaxID=765953 RepID=F8LEB1_9BACT|nr:putative uncharacterized protein [Waddlia chondrophila 2032/99]